MFATESLKDACVHLDATISKRLNKNLLIDNFEKVRFPVGLFFIRGNREGPGKELAKQVVASYDYWNDDSGKYIDMVFPGWGNDSGYIVFNSNAFLNCKNEVEAISKWKSTGETEVLLLNYDFKIVQWNGPQNVVGTGYFSFDETIILPIERMVKDGRIGSIDGFMQELINSAKENSVRSEESVLWALRDKVAINRGRKAVWEGIKKQFLKEFSKVYDELRPFVVCDLRRV